MSADPQPPQPPEGAGHAGADRGDNRRLRLAPHVRLKFDAARDRWVLLAPERLLLPDETALAILQQLDGTRTLAAVIDGLARDFDAPREDIARDVFRFVDDLGGKGLLVG